MMDEGRRVNVLLSDIRQPPLGAQTHILPAVNARWPK